MTKEIEKRPLTRYSLTSKGKSAFEEYLELLEEIVKLNKG